jgi:magnesium transporter
MRLRAVVVGQGRTVTLDDRPVPDQGWRESGETRWLIVENANSSDLARLFDHLGADGTEIANHIHGENWVVWRDRQDHTIVTLPEPTAWMKDRTWFHLVSLPWCFISVHGAEVGALEGFIQDRWLKRPGPETSMEDVLLFIIESLAGEESGEFCRVRLEVERHAEGLTSGDRAFTVERLENLMTRIHHMATVFFELQRLCESLEFSRARHVELVNHTETFRQGARSLRRQREGVEQVQRRLEELQRQHLMDQQKRTEGRVRVLTVLSAVFLPLTLISGIYGMNFVNMPELDDRYSYFIVLGGMVMLAASMIMFFARRGWFK